MNENKWYLQYESTGQLFLYEGDLKIAQILGGSKEKAIEVANKILAFPEMEKILIRNFVALCERKERSQKAKCTVCGNIITVTGE